MMDEPKIPCEFCDKLFPESEIILHMTGCNPKDVSLPRTANLPPKKYKSVKKQPKKTSYADQISGKGENENKKSYTEQKNKCSLPKTSCEFCEKIFPASDIILHMTGCNSREVSSPRTKNIQPNEYRSIERHPEKNYDADQIIPDQNQNKRIQTRAEYAVNRYYENKAEDLLTAHQHKIDEPNASTGLYDKLVPKSETGLYMKTESESSCYEPNPKKFDQNQNKRTQTHAEYLVNRYYENKTEDLHTAYQHKIDEPNASTGFYDKLVPKSETGLYKKTESKSSCYEPNPKKFDQNQKKRTQTHAEYMENRYYESKTEDLHTAHQHKIDEPNTSTGFYDKLVPKSETVLHMKTEPDRLCYEPNPKKFVSETCLLSKHFKNLLTNGNYWDTVLLVQDKKFKVHRAVLSVRSPVFFAMLQQNTSEKKKVVIKISDCDPDSFKVFLEYLYSGELENISSEIAADLCTISDKYNVEELKTCCEKYLTQNRTVKDIAEDSILAA